MVRQSRNAADPKRESGGTDLDGASGGTGVTTPGAAFGSTWSMNNEQLVSGGQLGLDISRFAGQMFSFEWIFHRETLCPGLQDWGQFTLFPFLSPAP